MSTVRTAWEGSAYVENGTEEDDTERVEVADDIVRDAIAREHVAKEVGGTADAVVVPVLHREEAEHAGSLHGALDILDEQIVVVCFGFEALGGNRGRLGRIPPPMPADFKDAAISHAVSENAENVGQVRTTGLVHDNTRAEPQKEGRQRNVEDEGN